MKDEDKELLLKENLADIVVLYTDLKDSVIKKITDKQLSISDNQVKEIQLLESNCTNIFLKVLAFFLAIVIFSTVALIKARSTGHVLISMGILLLSLLYEKSLVDDLKISYAILISYINSLLFQEKSKNV